MLRDAQKVMDLYRQVNVNLGGTGVEVELELEDFDVAFDEALRTYRTHSQNSVSFGVVFLNFEKGKQHYVLPDEVDEVLQLRRTRSGVVVGDGFEPFSASFLQQTLSGLGLTGTAGTAAGGGNLVLFEAVGQYVELLGRMFGEFIPYTFDRASKRLFVLRMPRTEELIMVEVSVSKPVDALLRDYGAYKWLRSYTEAHARLILAQKYGKVSNVPGALGGITLNAADLAQRGNDMKAALVDEILNFEDGNEPPMIFIG